MTNLRNVIIKARQTANHISETLYPYEISIKLNETIYSIKPNPKLEIKSGKLIIGPLIPHLSSNDGEIFGSLPESVENACNSSPDKILINIKGPGYKNDEWFSLSKINYDPPSATRWFITVGSLIETVSDLNINLQTEKR